MTDPRLANLDADLISQAETWAAAARRDHNIVEEMLQKPRDGGSKSAINELGKVGESRREQIRALERHAKMCTDEALTIRRQILGVNRGAGKKPVPAMPARPIDPATQALLAQQERKRRAAEVKAAETGAIRAGVAFRCEACGSCVTNEEKAAHEGTCIG